MLESHTFTLHTCLTPMSEPAFSTDNPVVAPPAALVKALRQVLRPLVKLMLSRGISCPFLTELLKQLFVEVAERHFTLDNRPLTDSRVSLVTGVHRKDVRRLRHGPPGAETDNATASLGAQIVAAWNGLPHYCDATGQPKPLALNISDGEEVSFEALVSGISRDIRSRAVLDEWLRLGVARLDAQNRVCLNAGVFVPEQGLEEKAFFLGHNLHDHAAAATHNVLGGKPAFLERSVFYSGLREEVVGRLAERAEADGMALLRALNRAAMESESSASIADASTQGQPRQRMTFGIYFYSETDTEAVMTAAPGAVCATDVSVPERPGA